VIFVDHPQKHETDLRWKSWCHMISDTSLEELHGMAAAVGLKREWFQGDASTPHYDCVPSRAEKAIKLGAKRADRREFVAAIQRLRAALGC
jgi:Protein of unknown function (DUF4031)